MDFNLEQSVSDFLQAGQNLPLPVLILLAFGGGLAASLTPCVVPLIPLYLTYIGVAEVSSKIDALKKSSLFCLGSATVFSIMGLFASVANLIMIEFRGYVHIAVGAFILFMSLVILDIIKIPLPNFIKQIPHQGPFIIGMTFTFVCSPCASPILFAVLALSAAAGSAIGSALIMIAYSFGYTGLIFITSLFAGIIKQLNFFKKHTKIVSVVSSIILGLLGAYYLYSGIVWFLG